MSVPLLRIFAGHHLFIIKILKKMFQRKQQKWLRCYWIWTSQRESWTRRFLQWPAALLFHTASLLIYLSTIYLSKCRRGEPAKTEGEKVKQRPEEGRVEKKWADLNRRLTWMRTEKGLENMLYKNSHHEQSCVFSFTDKCSVQRWWLSQSSSCKTLENFRETINPVVGQIKGRASEVWKHENY